MNWKNPTVAINVTEKELAYIIRTIDSQRCPDELGTKLLVAHTDMQKVKTIKNRMKKEARNART